MIPLANILQDKPTSLSPKKLENQIIYLLLTRTLGLVGEGNFFLGESTPKPGTAKRKERERESRCLVH